MRLPSARIVSSAVLPLLLACYRYVPDHRPMTEADCLPAPRAWAFLRQSPDSTRPGVAHGRVIVEWHPGDRIEPVVGAQVFIMELRHGTYTDSTGRFTLDSIPAGRHLLEIKRIGYTSRRDSLVLTAGVGMAVEAGLKPLPLDGCPFGVLMGRKRVWRWPWH